MILDYFGISIRASRFFRVLSHIKEDDEEKRVMGWGLTCTEQINQWRPCRRGEGAGKQRYDLKHAFTRWMVRHQDVSELRGLKEP